MEIVLVNSLHVLLLALLWMFPHIWLSSSNKLLKNWKALWKQINHLTQYCLLVCHKKSFQSMRSWISQLENLKRGMKNIPSLPSLRNLQNLSKA